jgi:hypothetical protein
LSGRAADDGEVDLVRDRECELGGRANELRVRAPRHVGRGDDALPGVPRLHVLADGDDVTRDLDSGRERRLAVRAHPHPDVREVDADRLGMDHDLAGARVRIARFHDLENIGPAGTAGDNLAHGRPPGRLDRSV